MSTTKCNCTPPTNDSIGLNLCVGRVEIGGASITQDVIVVPTTEEQEILPGASFDAFSKITVKPVDNTIDMNIIASNIRKGVTILGITGTYVGEEQSLENFPPYTTVGDNAFVAPESFEIFQNEGQGYKVLLPAEDETDEGDILKQKVAFASQFTVVGIKQWNEISQTWDWIYGSPEKSLTAFVINGTCEKEIDGKTYVYNIYENATRYAIGERELKFYTELPTEV